MATNFSPCKGSYVLNQFPSNVMFGMNGFHVSASGAIQGHHGPLVITPLPPQNYGVSLSVRLLVCSIFLFKLDPSYCITNFVQTSQIDSVCSRDVHIVIWSWFIDTQFVAEMCILYFGHSSFSFH